MAQVDCAGHFNYYAYRETSTVSAYSGIVLMASGGIPFAPQPETPISWTPYSRLGKTRMVFPQPRVLHSFAITPFAPIIRDKNRCANKRRRVRGGVASNRDPLLRFPNEALSAD